MKSEANPIARGGHRPLLQSRKQLIAALLAAVSVVCAQNPAAINAQYGSISGKLLALDGTPAVNVRVSAMVADTATQENGTALFNITQTDALGNYRLENVRPGRYYITA